MAADERRRFGCCSFCATSRLRGSRALSCQRESCQEAQRCSRRTSVVKTKTWVGHIRPPRARRHPCLAPLMLALPISPKRIVALITPEAAAPRHSLLPPPSRACQAVSLESPVWELASVPRTPQPPLLLLFNTPTPRPWPNVQVAAPRL